MRISVIAAVFMVIGVSDAFTVNHAPFVSTQGRDRLTQVLFAKQESEFVKHVVKTIGVLSLGSFLVFNVVDSSASAFVQPPDATMAVFSSSTQLAEAIKTMDLSLPSYDKISDTKNSDLSTLTITPSKDEVIGVAAKQKKSGISMSSVLPSMGKSAKKQAKVKEAAPEEEKSDKRMEKIKIVDMNMPSYSETTTTKEKSAFAI